MLKLKSLKIKNIISFKEAEFEFRNGKAIIIVGENLDDSSQRGNGSGKSSLIESISLAYSGNSIRDVKVKELIHNNADSGEVLLEHENTNGLNFTIWRKLYSNTKSAEYKAWLHPGKWQDEAEWSKQYIQSDMYSDLNSFNDFVWRTIGLSKEDFYSFFLITKADYTPFLKVGDAKKKEIINRFSGADKVDNVFFYIQEDADTVKLQTSSLEKELLQNQTRQQVLNEQLLEAKEEISEEKKNELINSKLEQLDEMILNTSHLEDAKNLADENLINSKQELINFEAGQKTELLQFEKNVSIAKSNLEAFKFSKNYDAEMASLKDVKNDLDVDIHELKLKLPKVKDQFKDEIDAITKEESETKASITVARQNILEYSEFIAQVEIQLADVIQCPKCQHKFSLKDKEFNVEEAVASLPDVRNSIEEFKELIVASEEYISVDLEKRKQDVNNAIIKAGEGIKEEIATKNNHLIDVDNQIVELNNEWNKEKRIKENLSNELQIFSNELQRKISDQSLAKHRLESKINMCAIAVENAEKSIQTHQQNIIEFEKSISILAEQEADYSKIEAIEKSIKTLASSEIDITDKLEAKRKELESVEQWECNFKNFKSYLANQSIKNIEDFTNLFLERMGSNLSISIDGYKTLSNKKIKEQITTEVLRDGFNVGSYGKFSEGERGRIDCATILGLQELILVNTGDKGIDMLIVDEILESVDSLGLESIISSLQSLQKTIMVVSQNDIHSLNNSTIIIQKKNKVSTILN